MTAPRLSGGVRPRARAAGRPVPHPAGRPREHPRPPTRAERLEPRVLLSTYTVVTTADDGPGSLRQAILDANAAPGADEVRFAIPGESGTVHTIRPLSPLPAVTGPTTLDATTQPGYAATPLIELDGSAAGAAVDGLTITARPSVVRGLAINRFGGNGIASAVASPSVRGPERVIIHANHIGTDPSGTVAQPNGAAGVRVVATFTRVLSNLISGNRGPGVHLSGQSGQLDDAWLEGNRIGTDHTGTLVLGNAAEGVFIEGLTSRAFIVRNVISGNGASGVRINRVPGHVFINANKVGTDVAGSIPVPNGTSPDSPSGDGITIANASAVSLSASNTISGNRGAGVAAADSLVDLSGSNRIGTDASGTTALGNGGDGVRFVRAMPSSTVSDSLISANGGDGVRIESSEQITIESNRIGTNSGRTAALGNGGNGITLRACRFVEVGNGTYRDIEGFLRSTPPNRIGGNAGHGIAIHGGLAAGVTSDISVFNNEIGYDNATRVTLPNRGSGIYVAGARGLTIGPVDNATHGNTIRGNGGDGVTVTDLGGTPSLQTRINSNVIYANAGLGIDLRPGVGVTPNDPRDADTGSNLLQNHPMITAIERQGATATIHFRLDTTPSRLFRIEVYANITADPSGHGEGERFIGAGTVSAGEGTRRITVPSSSLTAGSWLTATATDRDGNTSEFSPAVSATSARPVYRPPDRARASLVTAHALSSVAYKPARPDPLTPRGLLT
jgi:hypothetical protein